MSRRGWLWLSGAMTAVVGLVLVATDGPMWDAGGPGIVGFELAWTAERAAEIMVEWSGEGRDAARRSLWLDFLYLAGYGAFWALAAAAIRDRALDDFRPRLATAARLAVFAAVLAAACDLVENVALLLVLDHEAVTVGPPAAALFATAKFVLIGYAIGVVLLALALRFRRTAIGLVAAGVVLVAAVVVAEDRRTEPGPAPFVTATGTGEPLLLIHGFSVDHRWWDPVVPALARAHRVVRVDLRGHGRSEKPRDGYSIEAQADLVARAMRRQPMTVVGHSMGGAVAVALAERHPQLVERLMVIGTGPDVGRDGRGLSHRTPAFLPVTGHLVRAWTPSDWIRAELERDVQPGIDLSPAMAHAPDRTTWRSFDGSASAIADFSEAMALDERVRRTRKPFAAVFGTDDAQGDEADRYRRIPGARVIELPGLGHSPMVERPRLTARLIADFAALG